MSDSSDIAMVYPRRPLLVTGKSSLDYLISRELGPVLRWWITSRTTLEEGLCLHGAMAGPVDQRTTR